MSGQPKGWEGLYRHSPPHQQREAPHENVRYLHQLFQRDGVQRVLDLGCGNGRHLTFFSRLGYEICGLDYAHSGLRLAGQWLDEEGLSAELVCSDMTAIPFRSRSFDAVVSFQVLNHGLLVDIRRAISEVRRVLSNGGWLFAMIGTCRPPGPMRFRNGYEVEPGTYVLTDHPESGVPHHFFTGPELRGEFSEFRVVDFHWDSRSRACLLARKQQ